MEKSSNAVEWGNLGFFPGEGNREGLKKYEFNDDRFKGAAYYRLRQVNVDGRYSFSRIVSLKSETITVDITPYPNPVINRFKLSGLDTDTGPVTVQISDVSGRPLISFSAQELPEEGVDVSQLVSGIYLIKVKWTGSEKGCEGINATHAIL